MDCMQLMSEYPDKHFDLAIVDPPYGISAGDKLTMNNAYKHHWEKSKWDNEKPNSDYWKELFRVSKNQIVWGGNYFTDMLPVSRGWIYWHKRNPIFKFSDGELAWTSFDKVLKMFDIEYFGAHENGTICEKKIHPTQKPTELYKRILLHYANRGEKILDTHLGSGSIAIAINDVNNFENMGLTLTATELDEIHFADAMKRVKEKTAQINLFQSINH